MEGIMPTVFINCHHYEPGPHHTLTGLEFEIAYEGSTAEVSIQEMPVISESEHDPGIRAELVRLGQAIVQAAQSPQGVVSTPRPPH
jgi:hypothetical protein